MRHRQVLTAHVDAICPAGQGQVHLVVEDQGDVIPAAQGLDFQGLCQEGGWVQVFFPELDQGDTALEGGLQLFQQGLPPGPGPVGDSVKEKLSETEKNQKETISNSVKSAYDSLLLAQSGYEQAQSALALQEIAMKSADAKLAAGTITKNTYENQKASYTTAQVTAQTQKLSLLQAMNDYDWAVNGLASAE